LEIRLRFRTRIFPILPLSGRYPWIKGFQRGLRKFKERLEFAKREGGKPPADHAVNGDPSPACCPPAATAFAGKKEDKEIESGGNRSFSAGGNRRGKLPGVSLLEW